jgi:hypothetical protein
MHCFLSSVFNRAVRERCEDHNFQYLMHLSFADCLSVAPAAAETAGSPSAAGQVLVG